MPSEIYFKIDAEIHKVLHFNQLSYILPTLTPLSKQILYSKNDAVTVDVSRTRTVLDFGHFRLLKIRCPIQLKLLSFNLYAYRILLLVTLICRILVRQSMHRLV